MAQTLLNHLWRYERFLNHVRQIFSVYVRCVAILFIKYPILDLLIFPPRVERPMGCSDGQMEFFWLHGIK